MTGGVAELLLPAGALSWYRSSNLNSDVSISDDALDGPISCEGNNTLPYAAFNNRRWPSGRSGLAILSKGLREESASGGGIFGWLRLIRAWGKGWEVWVCSE